MAELANANEVSDEMVSRLHEARRRYAQSRSADDREEHDRVQEEADTRLAAMKVLIEQVEDAMGLPHDIGEALAAPNAGTDPVSRTKRGQLTADEISPTAHIEETLPRALEAVLAQLPNGWLDEEPDDRFALSTVDDGRPVSLIKGIRPESETTKGHRFRQSIRLAQAFLEGDLHYDHFGGAMLVPQLAAIGDRLELLADVPNSKERINNLWRKPAEVDATGYELLVAAALAEKGRKPGFVPETQTKTPDIQCTDPFPLVVECKRRRALSGYEQDEEAIMRSLFLQLDTEARRRGLYGVFELRLKIEGHQLDLAEVVTKAILHRLVAHPEKPLDYPWGSVAYRELPQRITLPGTTKAYSPHMLHYAFDWNSDLPEWDGLICKAATAEAVLVDEVREGVALAWSNFTAAAVEKRRRAPTSLFGSAVDQIPGGELGIVYLAYNEGAREEISDLRVEQVARRLHEWEHTAAIRIPVTFVSRLYPRALNDGQPDLIESTINYYSEPAGGDPWYFEHYPSRIFTPGRNPRR